jgi:hypothetical protein
VNGCIIVSRAQGGGCGSTRAASVSSDGEVSAMPNIETILRDEVSLQVECIDRIYLCGYVKALQRPNQLAYFLNVHRKNPLASPARLAQMTKRFVAAVEEFAYCNRIPFVQFKADQRKDDIARARFARFGGEEGVVFIGVAQEYDRAFRSKPRRHRNGRVGWFEFFRSTVAVKHFYFYILDRDWGPGFIKFSTYVPFGVRVCLNGHEWAKRQMRRAGVQYEALDNGFQSCADPDALQTTCDALGSDDIERFFRRWLARLPHPFLARDRAAGYRYSLSIWQMEFSLTQVFRRPLVGRQFFEELIRENLDLGRPDRIQLLFDRRVVRTGPHATPSSFRTRVIHHGVQPKLSVEYKHSRLKQYFKEGRALRTETVINNPTDLGVRKSLPNLPYLRTVMRNINRRLVALERTSHNCAIGSRTFESIVLPSVAGDGQRVPGLRFGEPRVMAVLAVLCHFLPTPDGCTNRMLRGRVGVLHDPGPAGYTAGRMTYDLRRLRLKGLVHRLPGKNRYVLTPIGRRVALFFTKTYARILRPGWARIDPDLPADATDALAIAWRLLDSVVERHVTDANLAP